MENLTYSQAVQEIEETIRKIENNEFSIDELSEKVKRVSFLLSFCKEKLRQSEDEVNKILDQMDK